MNKKQQQLKDSDNNLSIRQGYGQDLTQLASLTSRGENWVKTRSNQTIRNKTQFLVAEQDGNLVGFIQYRFVNRGINKDNCGLKRRAKHYLGFNRNDADTIIQPLRYSLIQEIYVHPAQHKQAILGALIDGSTESSTNQQLDELQVEVLPGDEAKITLLQAVGFRKTRVIIRKKLSEITSNHINNIRRADLGDLPQLIPLVKKEITYQLSLANSFELIPDVDWQGYISSKINNRDTALFVAQQNDQLTGYLEASCNYRGVNGLRSYFSSLLRKSLPFGKKYLTSLGVIEDIFVLPAFRKQAIGQNLVSAGEKWIRSLGLDHVHASIRANNQHSLNFFNAIGFKPVKVALSKRV
ncbi:GNAT family N-acetyltransferase [Chloroflexota bacterium]